MDLGTPEEAAGLIQWLEEKTLPRLFLTGFIAWVGPLSEQTSTCTRVGFTEFDIRAIMLDTVADSEAKVAMGPA